MQLLQNISRIKVDYSKLDLLDFDDAESNCNIWSVEIVTQTLEFYADQIFELLYFCGSILTIETKPKDYHQCKQYYG